MSADPRELALTVPCWCGALEGQPCLGRPSLRRAAMRERRSLHRWRYAKAIQPAWHDPGRPFALAFPGAPPDRSRGTPPPPGRPVHPFSVTSPLQPGS
jgi:hypothetical protein